MNHWYGSRPRPEQGPPPPVLKRMEDECQPSSMAPPALPCHTGGGHVLSPSFESCSAYMVSRMHSHFYLSLHKYFLVPFRSVSLRLFTVCLFTVPCILFLDWRFRVEGVSTLDDLNRPVWVGCWVLFPKPPQGVPAGSTLLGLRPGQLA